MEIIADGGSTKVDWVVLNEDKKEVFRARSLGLNPAVLSGEGLENVLLSVLKLIDIKEDVSKVHFYGAGCGTAKASNILFGVLKKVFINAEVNVAEDLLAAVYASSFNSRSIVCILGTGSNSCYYNGEEIEASIPSLGYSIMDEASGNYFGKKLLRDYYYKVMPENIRKAFEEEFDLEADVIKENLYRQPNPNMYLASFSAFMFDFKKEKYIKKLIKKGFNAFFKKRIIVYKKIAPIYFIGSIAYYFRDILEKTAKKNNLEITGVIQRPINNLIAYHQQKD